MGQITVKQMAFGSTMGLHVPTINETQVLVLSPASLEYDTARVLVKALLDIISGANTTNWRIDIYRGIDASGTRINNDFPFGIPVAQGANLVQAVIDSVQGLWEVQHAIAVTPTGATAPGSLVNYLVQLEVLAG